MIIIEGIDMVGKTRLAKKLVTKMNASKYCRSNRITMWYSHMTKPPEQWDCLNGYLDHINRWVVQDRFHYGRVVYSAADPKQALLHLSEKIKIIEGRLAMVGAVIIVITGTDDFLNHQWSISNRKEMYNLETILKANNIYQALGKCSVVDFHITMTKASLFPAEHFQMLEAIMRKWESRQDLIERLRPCYQN